MITTSIELGEEVRDYGFKRVKDGWLIKLMGGEDILGTVPVSGTMQFHVVPSGQRMHIEQSVAGEVTKAGLCESFVLCHENGMWLKGSVGSEKEDVDMRFPHPYFHKGSQIWIDTMTIWMPGGKL
jgi:hypothetical protein